MVQQGPARGRLLVVFLAAAFALASLTPAGAADVFRTSFKGGLALAVWTTCPDVVAGEVCDETVVIASDAMTAEHYPGGRERDRGPRVVLQRFVFEVVDIGDGELGFRPIRESFGGTSDAVVDIDRRSRSATASAAAIPMSTTEYHHGGDSVFFDETASLSVAWTGQGELRDIDERDHDNDRTRLAISYTKGWERSAVAAGSIDGVQIPGVLDESATTLINARQGEMTVYKRQP